MCLDPGFVFDGAKITGENTIIIFIIIIIVVVVIIIIIIVIIGRQNGKGFGSKK